MGMSDGSAGAVARPRRIRSIGVQHPGGDGAVVGVEYAWGDGNETSWLEWDKSGQCWICVSYVIEEQDGYNMWNEEYASITLLPDLAESVAILARDGGSIRVDDGNLDIALFLSHLAASLGSRVVDVGDAVVIQLTVNGARIEHTDGRLVIDIDE